MVSSGAGAGSGTGIATRPLPDRNRKAPRPPLTTRGACAYRPTMIHPTDNDLARTLAVRDGHAAPVTCAACGCRLTVVDGTWFHFNPLGGRDARGCLVACADAAHNAAGQAITLPA